MSTKRSRRRRNADYSKQPSSMVLNSPIAPPPWPEEYQEELIGIAVEENAIVKGIREGDLVLGQNSLIETVWRKGQELDFYVNLVGLHWATNQLGAFGEKIWKVMREMGWMTNEEAKQLTKRLMAYSSMESKGGITENEKAKLTEKLFSQRKTHSVYSRDC